MVPLRNGAPGTSASSATTPNGSPTRQPATPAPPQSPAPPATAASCSPATRNRRLGDAIRQWAFCSLRGSPGARAYYQTLRDRGIGHQAALRQLGNRFVGILHGCLKTGTAYDETKAWAAHHQQNLATTS